MKIGVEVMKIETKWIFVWLLLMLIFFYAPLSVDKTIDFSENSKFSFFYYENLLGTEKKKKIKNSYDFPEGLERFWSGRKALATNPKSQYYIFTSYLLIFHSFYLSYFLLGNISIIIWFLDGGFSVVKDLNDDHLPTLMGRVMAETRVSHNRPVTGNMASREHYLQHGVRIVDWTI